MNPNGKIPTIEDRAEGRAIFEVARSSGIWRRIRKSSCRPIGQTCRSHAVDAVQVGHVGPMMGQAMYFQHIAAPNGRVEPFSIRRYVDESRRLLEVMDTRLNGRNWIAADEYTIADMMLYPWARAYVWRGSMSMIFSI